MAADLAAFRVTILSLETVRTVFRRFWPSSSLPQKYRFPETETGYGGDWFESDLLSGQSQRLALTIPFRRQIR